MTDDLQIRVEIDAVCVCVCVCVCSSPPEGARKTISGEFFQLDLGQGWGSLVGCHLWGRTESGMTEAT